MSASMSFIRHQPFRTTAAAVVLGTGLATLESTASAGDELAPTLELMGTIRDFHQHTHAQGHPDFENKPATGFGRYSGNVSPILGEDGKPVFTGQGFKINEEYRDSAHRPICHLLYDEARGDIEGRKGIRSAGGITSAESFAQWFRDVPGVNMSMQLPLVFVLQADGTYVFDDQLDELYEDLGGFFPIDDQLFGNSGGAPDHNFHFTFELHTEFEYEAHGQQFFKFIGDDDVWVFVDGKLVVDLGGVHAAHDQFLDFSRLGLEDGEMYKLDFFFAERHRAQSNFRIVTNLKTWITSGLPTVTAAFD